MQQPKWTMLTYPELRKRQRSQLAALIRFSLITEGWVLERAAKRLRMSPGNLYNVLNRAQEGPLREVWEDYRRTDPRRGRPRRVR